MKLEIMKERPRGRQKTVFLAWQSSGKEEIATFSRST
jgi:hypothetical protein